MPDRKPADKYPVTPDGRYFVVRGRLWRRTDPSLPPDRREALVRDLMKARRALGVARREGDDTARTAARAEIDRTKVQLGERGATWWSDGAPDYNRRLAKNTPYADWFAALEA